MTIQALLAAGLIATTPGPPPLMPTVVTAPALRCPLGQPYRPDNPFARILRGQLPASTIYEDAQVMVVLPLEWEYPGHALVIPKRPVRNLFDMTPAEMGHALLVARRVGAAQRDALGSPGFTIVQNNARSQHVCHVHFHVIPDTPRAPQNPVPRGELERMAQRLRTAFRPD